MKGVILAGGNGTRLHPLTLVTNKHLLPVYDKPVIYYAIEKLVSAGITKIMIVTSPQEVAKFVSLLGSGQNFISKVTGKQIQIVYGVQNEPRGIAEGLWIAKDYVGEEDCLLCLGDNIIEDEIGKPVSDFKGGATVFLKKVSDPQRFGVASLDRTGRVLTIEEKPKKPKSDLAVIGLYIFDNSVFKKMIGQPLSKRGEYEITYITNKYIKEKKLKAVLLEKEWFDIGTIESLMTAGLFRKNQISKL
jgi:glucose-1-phosphate thymidylyltransferase